MRCLLIFLIPIIGYSCHEKPVETPNIVESTETQPCVERINLDSLWQVLVFEKGGCLTGGQRVHDGSFGGEGCVLTDDFKGNGWKSFFSQPKEELKDFLIPQLADTSTTRIHTCPFFKATNGEVAVYCLTNNISYQLV